MIFNHHTYKVFRNEPYTIPLFFILEYDGMAGVADPLDLLLADSFWIGHQIHSERAAALPVGRLKILALV